MGGQFCQNLTLESLNRNAYSPKNEYNTLNLSIEKFKAKSISYFIIDSRTNSFNSTNLSPRKPTSNSTTWSHNKNEAGFHLHSSHKVNPLDLVVPSSEAPLYFSKYSTDKIKREISEVTKSLIGDDTRTGFRNRPAVDLNKPHMDFNSRIYFAMSPTTTRKSFLTTSNVFKNLSKKKHIINSDEYLRKYNFSHMESDFDTFAKDLLPKKKSISVFERFPLNWRFKASFN